MSALTIVMYHYVRDLAHSRYPAIKGLHTAEFAQQLDWITQRYTVCSTRDVIAASRGERPLPPNACLLTFDDGLIDHFTVVFPELVRRGLTASFYPPVAAVAQLAVLDTHKIHFILASVPESEHPALAWRLLTLIDARRYDRDVPPTGALWSRWARPSRYDGAEVAFIKSVLQHALPGPVREAITARLFDEFVGVDERTFARELYMDVDQLRYMFAHGMEVGGHGARHVWLDTLSCAQQREEIAATTGFLREVHGGPPVDWVMCYPFGAYNAKTLALLPPVGCALGLTTRVGTVTDLSSPFVLPRLDTNDLPPRGDASALR